MPRDLEPSLNEKNFTLQALKLNIRADGRKLDEFRKLNLTFGDEYGMADVTLGKTRVIARVSAEVAMPYTDRPYDGIFTISIELSPMTAPSFEVGRSTEAESLLSRLLEKTVRRSGALDMESLCLVAGSKCWSVRVDVHVVSHDGGLADAACAAVVAALRHFRRPDSAVDGEAVTVWTAAEREPVPLGWLHTPLCVSFGFVGDGGETVVADADWLEEQLQVASCTIGLNRHGEVCQIAKLGGMAVDALTLLRCTSLAVERVKELSDLLDRGLAEDAKQRDKGGLMAELRADNAR